MAKRKHITLIYQYNENWIGGTYYILNIVRSLKFLDDRLLPAITIVFDLGTSIDEVKAIEYPYIDFVETNLKFNRFETLVNKFSLRLFGKRFFKKKLPFKKVENFYPLPDYINPINIDRYFYWIPDFQERYLPEFFSNSELRHRAISHNNIISSESPVVFSSYNAQNDYNTFYPNNKNKQEVLQFVSIIDKQYNDLSFEDLSKKYEIVKPYFIVCNQFWKHKNHYRVLNALLSMENKDEFQILFTGKEFDFRYPNYPNELRSYISENKLDKIVKYLGFIGRNEQLQLMNNSIAIIQPSLFEGWSTVVEDAKAINHLILLSDIPLHREQIGDNCLFFDPYSSESLSECMKTAFKFKHVVKTDYEKNIKSLARKFISIFD